MKYYVVCHTIGNHAGSTINVCQKIRSTEAADKPADKSLQGENSTEYFTYFDSRDDAEKYRDVLIRFRDYYRNVNLLNKCSGYLGVLDI